MIPQQMRKPPANQLQQIVYQNIQQHTAPMNGMSWQSSFPVNERMGKALDLYVLRELPLLSSAGMMGETGADLGRQNYQHRSGHGWSRLQPSNRVWLPI